MFGSHFVLMWDGTLHQFGQAVRRKYDPAYDTDGDFVGRCVDVDMDTRHVVIIMLPKWNRRSNMSHAILVHELFHATELALRFRDIEPVVETSELYAYFLDYLVQQCLKRLP